MTPRTLTKLIAGPALCAAVLTPTAAWAIGEADPATDARIDVVQETDRVDLDAARERCLEGIDRRLEAIDRAQVRIDEAVHLTDAHEATLETYLADTVAGLTALQPEIEAAPDPETLRPLCQSVVYDYRVFVLRLPQVHLTIGADAGDAAVLTAEEIVARLDAAITAAQEAGLDVENAPELLAEIVVLVDAAEEAIAGTADAVLPLTPADYNDGLAEPILDQARADLQFARSQFFEARRHARAIVDILKGAGDVA